MQTSLTSTVQHDFLVFSLIRCSVSILMMDQKLQQYSSVLLRLRQVRGY
jgi:hypothetical protein